jgi:hypothetical protein
MLGGRRASGEMPRHAIGAVATAGHRDRDQPQATDGRAGRSFGGTHRIEDGGLADGRRRIGELSVDQDIAPVNRVRRTSSSLSVTCR